MEQFDIVVIGGGHAGVEAASVARRRSAKVALVTQNVRAIGAMSCNPAIGGVGKGHLVRELDVFGGIMARAADAAAIHYRMLNTSKGVAVHGPRVQADRLLYADAVQREISALGIVTVSSEVHELAIENGRASGVYLADGTLLPARAIIVATGTFLGGRLFRGRERFDGGRVGEPGAHRLAAQFRDLGFAVSRLKTGTPPRLDGRTIDWSKLDRQPSDRGEWTMSIRSHVRTNAQLFCGVTRTNDRAHDIIRRSMDASPLRTGDIVGQGPRYCPSIEDKVARFGDRDGHGIFLEPETLSAGTIYPNGISTSLPIEAQLEFIAAIDGLRDARIVEPGYAVEYDFLDPRALDRDLACHAVGGLHLAGQINGTTGYEEAAAQGLVAGLAASSYAIGAPRVSLERHESYVGLLVDDLTSQGVTEPYRMLTSRAEHRLALRADNACSRLGDKALASHALLAAEWDGLLARCTRKRELEGGAASWGSRIDRELLTEMRADRTYAPYCERETAAALRTSAANVAIPADFAYQTVPGLSLEMIERLRTARPDGTSQASRIAGVTPAALTALHVALSRRNACST